MTPQPARPAWWIRGLLWILALFVMLSAAVFQRLTGPTYPLSGETQVPAGLVEYDLIRSETTDRDARVEILVPEGDVRATLFYKRYGTADSLTAVSMQASGDTLFASLPRQPAAGKLAYQIEVRSETAIRWVPDGEMVIMRYKDPVPLGVLLAHVITMFIGMWVGVRAALAAAFDPPGARNLTLAAFSLITVGGMVLGPIVQNYAFGAYWTGFPFGYDLTDNKTLLMWVVWLAAVGGYLRSLGKGWRRALVGLAAVAMLVVYTIPHSLGGSELDYDAIDRGVDPSEAIGTQEL